ncbi:HD domain-containing protein [Candidatus Saccharibacteria bacterium]|nr:HD domain-containing protein [Candidatus Saccharibacteria bacterium]
MKRGNTDPNLFAIQQLVIELALIDRNHYLANHERRENDIEHSFAVTMLCWYVYDKLEPTLSLEKILQYALAHDFVEKYAGDTNTFATNEERDKKIVREHEALDQLCQDFSSFSGLVNAMRAYEDKSDDESLFVWTVDKMQALIMGDLDNWRPYQELYISYDDFVKKYSELLTISSPYAKDIFSILIEYCKTTFYDQPPVST